MTKTLVQKIVFKNSSTKTIYDLYMNSKKHSAATGAHAILSDKIGGKYFAHDGYISGKNLYLVKNQLIVQTWRTISWKKDEADSVFMIGLTQKGKNVVLEMAHALIPEKYAASIKKGWNIHYWEPWKMYLSGKPILASPSM